MRKKLFFPVLYLCMVVFFVGCGNKQNEPIAGEWKPTTISINGMSIEYNELDNENAKYSFNFDMNGSCTAVIAGMDTSGTYVFNNTAVDVNLEGKEYKMRYEAGKLILNYNYDGGKTSITFAKVI